MMDWKLSEDVCIIHMICEQDLRESEVMIRSLLDPREEGGG